MKLLKINREYEEEDFYLVTDLHQDDVEVFILKALKSCEETGELFNSKEVVKALGKRYPSHEVMMFDDIIDLLI
jgi:hypothetical protein